MNDTLTMYDWYFLNLIPHNVIMFAIIMEITGVVYIYMFMVNGKPVYSMTVVLSHDLLTK